MLLHRILWVWMGLALLGLTGCTTTTEKKQNESEAGSSAQAGAQGGGPETQQTAPSPEDPPKTSGSKEDPVKNLMTKPLVSEDAMRIKPPGTSAGYKPVKQAPSLKDMGQKVDQAIANLPPSMVDGRITFSTGEGELMGKAEVKVQDAKTFRVPYNLPRNKAESEVIVADGARLAEKSPAGWKMKQKEKGSLSAQEIEEWPMEFTGHMFQPLTDGKSVWGPLFAAWQAKGAKVEEKPQVVNGKKKTLYRIILSEKDTQLEVILDGDRMLPVTVRSDSPRKGGGRDKMMWTGQWLFGGSHKPSDFLIPMK